MKRTNFYFQESMLERLKSAKQKTGVPVSEMIRRAVDAFLKAMGV
jgi:predicted DNA-binding protein